MNLNHFGQVLNYSINSVHFLGCKFAYCYHFVNVISLSLFQCDPIKWFVQPKLWFTVFLIKFDCIQQSVRKKKLFYVVSAISHGPSLLYCEGDSDDGTNLQERSGNNQFGKKRKSLKISRNKNKNKSVFLWIYHEIWWKQNRKSTIFSYKTLSGKSSQWKWINFLFYNESNK